MMAYYDANGVKLGDERWGDYFYDANGVLLDAPHNRPMFWPRYRPPVFTEEEARDIRNGSQMGFATHLVFEPTGFPPPEDPIGSFNKE
jgi:hypothetical protein